MKNIYFRPLIYICIIIVIATTIIRPKPAYALCPDTAAKIQEIFSKILFSDPSTALKLHNIILDIMTSCDGTGNPVTPDPNSPVPTIDPNAPTPPPGDGTLAFFCQVEDAVQDHTSPYINPSIMNYGCGPLSMSMAYCTKKGWDNNSRMSCDHLPVTFAEIMQSKTCAAYGKCYGSHGIVFTNEIVNGKDSGVPAVVQYLKQIGRQVEIVSGDLAEWEKKTSAGYLLITYSPDTPCAEGCAAPETRKLAHVFVVDYVDLAQKRVRLRDSINCGASTNNKENGGGRYLYPLTYETTYAEGPQNFLIKPAFAVK